MRLVLATASLFTVAFLATSMSNTERADRANANLALSVKPDEIPRTQETEDPKFVETSAKEITPSAPENLPEIDSYPIASTTSTRVEPSEDQSLRQEGETVRKLRLEGPSRSPLFIPEFSAASPWANVAGPEEITSQPLRSPGSVPRYSPPPRAPVAMQERGVSPSPVAAPVTPVVTEITEQPRVKVENVSRDQPINWVSVQEHPDNSFSEIVAVPSTPKWLQPRIEIPPVVQSDRGQELALPQISPPPVNSVAIATESIPIQVPQVVQERDSARLGSAIDLLPMDSGESHNPAPAIALVQSPSNSTPGRSTNPTPVYQPDPRGIQLIQEQVQQLQESAEIQPSIHASPALSIFNPTGYGADRNTGYLSATYQSRTRFVDNSDGAVAIGFGFGDSRDLVGVELSYTVASVFGNNRDIGTGGFNVKVHRQFANDWAIAAGWNGFLFLGEDDGFENSLYGTVTKIIHTQESLSSPLSRIAITAGVGNGQFQSEDSLENDRNGINVFGSMAVRVIEPVSVIAEWTGQDLAVGASIAPFKNIPFVITPAVRDLAGAGDGPRFVLGAGLGWRF
ncbi:hypothetical protein J0895_01710 [Phormidium pseudopriestleyi FRX01]|uniref:Uncharacterized protein n=1 Tax=Phormidium pseudopriestleyi FRX01 TaxID=1759528 RepID=A0ABS3FLY5_9CYAN|nr:hypothetical protein [Phormidium pseudopriestleyi]MBO0347843.1 hypothetical protein [Phormidium pseudopriestleyi FRX01]